jgi:hypothetical protein
MNRVLNTVDELIRELKRPTGVTIKLKKGLSNRTAIRAVYETQIGGPRGDHGITYGGGVVAAQIVDEALRCGLIKPEFPDAPHVRSFIAV